MDFRRVAAGAVAVAAYDGGLAAWAQHAGRVDAALNDYPFYGYSLTKHVLAMFALAALTLVVAAALTDRFLAVLVVLGAVAGPMTVIAAPVNASLVSSFDDTAAWWHLLTGAGQAAILLGATAWTTRRTPSSSAAIFAVSAAAALTVQIVTAQGISQQPGLAPLAGWALLSAGMALLALRSEGTRTPAALLTAPALVLITRATRSTARLVDQTPETASF